MFLTFFKFLFERFLHLRNQMLGGRWHAWNVMLTHDGQSLHGPN